MKLNVLNWTAALALMACDGSAVSTATNAVEGLRGVDAGAELDGRPRGVVDCFSDASREHPATKLFWNAMLHGDYAQRDQAIEQLAAAASAQPDQEQFALLSALGNLWRAAEGQDLWDLTRALDSALTAEQEFQRAYALCPSDVRILAWWGPLKIMLGGMLGDSARSDEGARLIEEGTERYPVFIAFSNVVAYGGAPVDGPLFKKALEAVRYYLDDLIEKSQCQNSEDPSCRNTEHVPHNAEGTALFMGDVFVRAQDRERALASYKVAERAKSHATWPFRSLMDERIRNLDANLRAAGNAIDLDDPEWAWSSSSQCSFCHRQ